MASVSVRDLDALAECRWDFRRGPQWQHPHGFAMGANWDPTPGYRHDYGTAAAAVHVAVDRCPPLYDITVYVADHEDEARTNGWAHLDRNHHAEDGDPDVWLGVIMLAGKRIPPHPAMTRHLAAHEYGHHVEWMANMARGASQPHHEALIREYIGVRGLPEAADHHGEAGSWHDSAHEIFADDFRILCCETEPEYWPHPGIARPEAIRGLAQWWAGALRSVRASADDPGVITVA